MEILTPFTGEVLVLSLLLFLNGRIFFTRRTRHDALAILAPLSIFICILEMFAWGVRIANIAIMLLALISTVLNYRSIVRFSQGLFVDTYSVRFFIPSLVVLVVSALLLAAIFLLRPVRLQTFRYNVTVSREYYSCPMQGSEIKKALSAGDKRNMTLYTFSNSDMKADTNTVIVFVPDIQAETLNYEPYLILLARAGYTVISADLYEDVFERISDLKKMKFLRRFTVILNTIKGKTPAMRAAEYEKLYEKTCAALASVAQEKYPGKKIFVVSDQSSTLSPQKTAALFAHNHVGEKRALSGSLDISTISEYPTPGYGFVAQTNPIFSWLCLKVPRDKKSFAPSYCVLQTVQKIVDNKSLRQNKQEVSE